MEILPTSNPINWNTDLPGALLPVVIILARPEKLAKEMTHDLEMNFNKIAPFGKEDTAKELQDHAAKTQDTLVRALSNTSEL